MKQIERQMRDLQKELTEAQKDRQALRLKPCRGDRDIREKDEALDQLDSRMEVLQEQIRELGKKHREMMSEAVLKSGYETHPQ